MFREIGPKAVADPIIAGGKAISLITFFCSSLCSILLDDPPIRGYLILLTGEGIKNPA